MEEIEKMITTNLGRRTVVVLRYTGTPEQADNTDRQLLEFLRRIRRRGAQFEYLAVRQSEGKPTKSTETRNWHKN